ncbi:hypothetical protein F5Y17DRAFT_440970 [Xylariaceae sp. FL0594]|nr:hypothetical protein F5Y17DRAFT_440970 [Xylariaceae sp. FL0594]
MEFMALLLWLVALLASVLASPAGLGTREAPSPTLALSSLVASSAVALVTPVMTAAPSFGPRDDATPTCLNKDFYTVTIVNKHSADVKTYHETNYKACSAFHDDRGFIPKGGSAEARMPVKWGGRIGFAESEHADYLYTLASLLEGAFDDGDRYFPEPRINLDVSYVDGFTLPMTCSCKGEVVLGCNLDLLKICHKELQKDPWTCVNQMHGAHGVPNPNNWADCEKLAFTFPDDADAAHNSIPGCERNLNCCIGIDCAPHPQQKMCPNKRGGYAHPCNQAEP